jgi:uncharacterized membrane protein (UPF0127 family)
MLNSRVFGSIVVGGLILVLVLSAVWIGLHFDKHPGLHKIQIGDQRLSVYVADTDASRELGLSGRNGLLPDEGMLFIFPIEGKFAFWMKDMKFSIDIIWVANDGSVIYIEKNISPDTYPKTFAPTSGLARYVLEVPAGFCDKKNIAIGSKVVF